MPPTSSVYDTFWLGQHVIYSLNPELGIGRVVSLRNWCGELEVEFPSKWEPRYLKAGLCIHLCNNCKRPALDHMGPTLKCLFEASTYTPEVPPK